MHDCEGLELSSAQGRLTTAVSANGPDITSIGRDMARAQCLVADSQSWLSIAEWRSIRDDYSRRDGTWLTRGLEINEGGTTLSSITCPTRSPASRTRPISSSSDRTLPPTRSAVFAVLDTLSERSEASCCKPSKWGTNDCSRLSELMIGSLAFKSSVKEFDSSASSD